MPYIRGELKFHESEGGFAPPGIEVGGVDLSVWLAEQFRWPVTKRGSPDEGSPGEVEIYIIPRRRLIKDEK